MTFQKKTDHPDPPPGKLWCSHCRTFKPVESFYKTTCRACKKRGYTYTCKDCARQAAQDIRKKKIKEKKHDGSTPTTDTAAAVPATK